MWFPRCSSVAVCGTVLATVLVSCATPSTGPRLSQSEVVRIADAKARQIMQTNLQYHRRSEPSYVPGEHAWWVGYLRGTTPAVDVGDFSVRVDDMTKEASIIVSDPGSAFGH
jgi:hypothetical protein